MSLWWSCLLGALLISSFCLKRSLQQHPETDILPNASHGAEVEPCRRITNCAVMFVRKFRTYLFKLASKSNPFPGLSPPRTVSPAEVTSSGEVFASKAETGGSNTTCESEVCEVATLGMDEAPLLGEESPLSQKQRQAPSGRHSRTPALPSATPPPSSVLLGGVKAFRAAEQPGNSATLGSEYHSIPNGTATARQSPAGAALGKDSIGVVAIALLFAILALVCMILSRRVLVVYTNKMSV